MVAFVKQCACLNAGTRPRGLCECKEPSTTIAETLAFWVVRASRPRVEAPQPSGPPIRASRSAASPPPPLPLRERRGDKRARRRGDGRARERESDYKRVPIDRKPACQPLLRSAGLEITRLTARTDSRGSLRCVLWSRRSQRHEPRPAVNHCTLQRPALEYVAFALRGRKKKSYDGRKVKGRRPNYSLC